MDNSEPEVLLRRPGRLGHILLNRPKAINALTHTMVKEILAALNGWEADDGVATVLLTGSGERGLCAGGDVVAIYRDALAGGGATEAFWADEYTLNARIAGYPKPYVAFMDGLVLGGGVGLSAHGSVRIVTERTRVGMPEVGIGFVPDIGGTWLLSRAPGELGTHLALTAGQASGPDAIALGLADYFVASGQLPALAAALEDEPSEVAVRRFAAADVPPSPLAGQRDWIDACYAGDSVEEILRRLQAHPAPAAREAAEAMRAKSPTALKVTLAALRRARTLGSLEEVLDQEYRVSLRCLAGTEFPEGVRAQLVDKDRSPRWDPPVLEQVATERVEAFFAGLGRRELGLALARSRP
ncbi:enoyl-CoA hydratase/isomerase family protein [Arthrobacter sp. I2-34]|uniref:3-hydroxyisobutyryl-CoA hydrolase n=1 Tax=Arthrobacter hankyongi TaxID=2904801 RepID=A0ABS9L396_9MICC|nr:enoyl-CoA hydratase/isomerase family protein [Arthrobacter hankyongi]MCG2621080.1 enoyl-CoA hydratase/isomerase family protein [Arthrobacter hankyongi]